MDKPQGGGDTATKPRKFIAGLTFGWEGTRLEEANEKVQRLLAHAEEMGLQLIDGSVSNSRERDPVESISYASDGVWRNNLAEEGHFLPVDAVRYTEEQMRERGQADKAETATPAGAPTT